MRFAVIGATLSGNKGAAAMLDSSIQHLSEGDPDAQFDVLTVYPQSDSAENSNPAVRILDASPVRLGAIINGASLAHRLLPPLRARIEKAVPEVEAIANADVLLDEGGITFVDGRGKFLIYNVATILPGVLLRTPVVKVAQAMGPFNGIVNHLAARALLPKMAMIFARGDQTLEHLQELGLHNVKRSADIAFGLEVKAQSRRDADTLIDPGFFKRHQVVGFCPSAVLYKASERAGGDYISDCVRLVDHITNDKSLPVLLLAHSARTRTEKSHNNDLPLCREIYRRVASPSMVEFVDRELTPEELRCLIGECSVFVAARFHAMVSALACAVPTVVIGWSHKYGEVLADFDLNRFAVPLADATDARVGALLDEALAQRELLSQQITNRLERVRDMVTQQFSDIQKVASAQNCPGQGTS